MKHIVLMGILVGLVVSGCVVETRQTTRHNSNDAGRQQCDSAVVLSCLRDLKGIKTRAFRAEVSRAAKALATGGDEARLRFICVSLHPRANYTQFRQGVDELKRYIDEHPEREREMAGLLGLVDRLDQAKIKRWSVRKKLLRENERLEDRLAEMEQAHKEDQVRLQALRRQIEQLKNIENIIKNREHSP